MIIAILGAGNIGSTLGKKWMQAGHHVIFGVRDPESPKAFALRESVGAAVEFTPLSSAIAAGEVILFSTPHAAVAGIVSANSPALDGKIILDATNNFGAAVVNNLGTILGAAPNAQVYRAFNASGWENFANPIYADTAVDCFYCGPDQESRPMVEDLIVQVGLRPVYVGGLELAPVVDALGALWVTLALRRGYGRGITLKLIQR